MQNQAGKSRSIWATVLENHVFTNLAFLIVIFLGIIAFTFLPREKDPEINFNWIDVTTFLPGASAEDIEKKITDPIEDALAGVPDIKFVMSTSRDSISRLLIRFEELDEDTFDKRIATLRREIQSVENTELPDDATSPVVFEITSSSGFPIASIAAFSEGDDEHFRYMSRRIQENIERIKGVDRVNAMGDQKPEIHIAVDPDKLLEHGLLASSVANTLRSYINDLAMGAALLGQREWIFRISGADDIEKISELRLLGSQSDLRISDVATVFRSIEQPWQFARVHGKPAVVYAINKKANENTIALLERIREYIDEQNQYTDTTGISFELIDDQTISTQAALKTMYSNAALGLFLVLCVTWIFLGGIVSIFTTLGIVFTLAGTAIVLFVSDMTLNNSVLLGVVISLGMLVDDAVVVVEAIYYRIQRGVVGVQAAMEGIHEVAAPVISSVCTTIAAFLPLMLLPGIMGKFLFIVPFVVTMALLLSLVEAFWMLPSHVVTFKSKKRQLSNTQKIRNKFTHYIQLRYVGVLTKFMRYPIIPLLVAITVFGGSIMLVGTGKVGVQFFKFDPIRLFYVTIDMPPGTPAETTIDKVVEVESKILEYINPEELRNTSAYSGQAVAEAEYRIGTHIGQIMVSLHPKGRTVDDIIESMRADVMSISGPTSIYFMPLKDGPPAGMPIDIKVRGTTFDEIQKAANEVKGIVESLEGTKDILIDDGGRRETLDLRLISTEIARLGLSAQDVTRSINILLYGEIISDTRIDGEKVDIRLVAEDKPLREITDVLATQIPLPSGATVPLSQLVDVKTVYSRTEIKHYNYRRNVNVQADIDKEVTTTQLVNEQFTEAWGEVKKNYPNIDLDTSGELDDIEESLSAMLMLFVFGVGLIYLIVATQFRSYFQPIIILLTIVMAFSGVIYGLFLFDYVLSLFTIYGMIALAGISVNASIVLISAANARIASGMSVLHAIVYASRRRVIPIIITSLTTVAGLFSLATGLGGKSQIWGPIATAIVSGLIVSTILTLFLMPIVYLLSKKFGQFFSRDSSHKATSLKRIP